MKRKKYPFTSVKELSVLIAQYFDSVKPLKRTRKTTGGTTQTEKPSEPPTISGLAFHLGFNTREEFENAVVKGKYAAKLKRAHLRIMAEYEKKLHSPSSAGAIFALRSMGLNDRAEGASAEDIINGTMNINIIHTGPPLASSEQEIVM